VWVPAEALCRHQISVFCELYAVFCVVWTSLVQVSPALSITLVAAAIDVPMIVNAQIREWVAVTPVNVNVAGDEAAHALFGVAA